jgi:ubiquinone/menaquinone biosynthesis C-methylase UbiE
MNMQPAARRIFLEHYAAIRHAEGRGSGDPAYFRALPYRDLTGTNSGQWAIRARSYRHFEGVVLSKIERRVNRPLDVLDLGAGNGWMSYRLALRDHRAVALDIFPDERDGLGAIRHYPVPLAGVIAEFDHLPFREASFDVAIYNSSLHYSSDYRRALREVRRCLRRSGCVIVMDSPIYKLAEHGERMRAERQARFEKLHGFRSEAQGSIEYLDEGTLSELSREIGIQWRRSRPWLGWHWALRPWKARLTRRRPPSHFFILTGRFT